jgi:ATP-binding protein involved in chromosome partitioning
VTEQNIKDTLSKINEPILNKDFTSLDLFKDISLKGKDLNLVLGITDIHYKGIDKLSNVITKTLKKDHPLLDNIDIGFSLGVINHKNKKKSEILPGVKNTIAIASGKGGVGKSTVAVNIAAALARDGASVGLIDADIYGPSVPLMLGVDKKPQVVQIQGKNRLVPIIQYGIKLMSIGFLTEKDSAIIWRGPMASSALKQFMSDVLWEELDYLLYDMPPGTGDIQLTLSQTLPLTGVIIITTPQDIALADAKKGRTMFNKVNVPTIGIIENMSYYLKSDGEKDYIFGKGGGKKMSEEDNVTLLGEIPINTNIRESGDIGTPIVIRDPESQESKVYDSIIKSMIMQVNLMNVADAQTPNLEIIMDN